MSAKRRVKRSGLSGRQAIVKRYGQRQWYDLPDWAIIGLAANAWRAVLFFTIVLAPAALLGIVIGVHSLPLDFLGFGTHRLLVNGSGVGLAGLVFLVKFGLLAYSIKPLKRLESRGLTLVLGSALVHFVHSILLQHAISGLFLLLVVGYLYWQLRPRFS